MKRLFDIVFSLLGLLFFSPAFLMIMILIKREDRGPAIYRGLRVGYQNKPFKMYKFRTMVIDAEKLGGHNTSNIDTRITEIGKKLRKTKLDELPQLINVLKGDMSFVGPRPEVAFYINMFTEEEKSILTVKPGITDWATLWDHDEGALLAKYDDPDKAYLEIIRPMKTKLQLEYAKKHNLFIDLKIIWLTVKTIFSKKSLNLP